MSYLVLARKYRPQTFAEMVGQEHVTRTLSNAIASGRIHHAFLFCGARGVGKTTAARILAKCLSCEQAPTATPCNVCDACREITAGTSVDVQEIDGASNNSVEDVRTLRENVRYLPVRGKKKVYIIDEVHMLSSGAFNALLKTLEEPPPHALFVFATTEAHKIPITILSRLQRYDFRLVSAQRVVEHLASVLDQEKIAHDRGALQVIAREAQGSVRDALSLLEQVLAVGPDAASSERAAADALGVADRTLIASLAESLLARDAGRALALAGEACDRAVDVRYLAGALLEQLRNLVVARVVSDPSALIAAPDSELAEMVRAAKAAPAGLLELLFERLSRMIDEIARSPLPRYVLEVGLVELTHVEPLEPVADLVDRLEKLESRLAGGPAPPRAAPSGRPPPSPSPARGPSASAASAAPPAPAPTAPAPAAAAPPPSARPADWSALSQALFARNPARFAPLLSGREVTFAPPKLVVAFQKGFDADQARERIADALPIASELCGVSVTIEVVEGAGAAPSVLEAEEQKAQGDRDRRRKEALDHPARQMVVDAFGPEVQFKEPEVE
jgi:DNA polymerase-3 subunit gamma/tau